MVRFKKIMLDDSYIYALAEDSDEVGKVRKVQIAYRECSYWVEGDLKSGSIVRALRVLQESVSTGRIGSRNELVIKW